MTVEEFQQQLMQCITGSSDPTVTQSAKTANQYTELFKSGQISKDEYIDAISDIAYTNKIAQSATNIQFMENMNAAINGLISLAEIVP